MDGENTTMHIVYHVYQDNTFPIVDDTLFIMLKYNMGTNENIIHMLIPKDKGRKILWILWVVKLNHPQRLMQIKQK